MSCLIDLLEKQRGLLEEQVKAAALSHDLLSAKVTSLEAEKQALVAERDRIAAERDQLQAQSTQAV